MRKIIALNLFILLVFCKTLSALPSPFEIGRQVGNNFATVRKEARDQNIIKDILEQAMRSENPEDTKRAICRVISQVSPKKQTLIIEFLQNRCAELEKKQNDKKYSSLKNCQEIHELHGVGARTY